MILDQKVRIFLKVARDGGFRKAARGLGLSQSSVSFHIHKLEAELDVQLFRRQGRTISLTREGRFLFEELESLEREARRVENSFALHSNVLGRQIRVGSNTLACPYTLPWVIQSFSQEHPELVFTYKHMGNEQELMELLVVGDLDVGIFGHPVRHRKLAVHRCYESEIVLAASPTLGVEQVEASELSELPIVLENSDRGLELAIAQGLRTLGLSLKDLRIVIECDNLPLIQTFVQAGLGAAFLPRIAVLDQLKSGALSEIQVPSLEMKQAVVLAHSKSAPANPNTVRFIEFVESRAGAVVLGLE